MYLNVYNGITVGKIGKKSKRNKVLKSELGGLLPTNGIKRTEYYETIRPGVSFSIGAPTNEFVYVSHNDGEMMIYVDSTGIVTKIFSSADKIISISLRIIRL